jgi:hypothetical protein
VKEIPASGRLPRHFGRWLAPVAGGSSLVAAGLVVASLFPAFVSQVCPGGCEGISASLGQSPDAWAIAWIAGVLAATAALVLAGVAARAVTALNAAAALAALGLAIFEGVMAFPRVLGSAELVPGGIVHDLGPGYFLMLAGGVAGVCASAAMLLATRYGGIEIRPVALAGRPGVVAIGRASLVLLIVAFAGMFLPFVTVSCGFGCPPFAPSFVVYSGNFVTSFDGPIVIALLAGGALATVIRMTGQGKVVAPVAAAILTLAAAILVSFDSLNGATRVLAWPYPIPTVPDPGYYVVQIATALCVLLSVLLVTADPPSWAVLHRIGPGSREPAPSA